MAKTGDIVKTVLKPIAGIDDIVKPLLKPMDKTGDELLRMDLFFL